MITLNGSVKFRNRRLPIFWTGEFAQHLAEKNKQQPNTHPTCICRHKNYCKCVMSLKKQGKVLWVQLKKMIKKL